MPNQTSLVFPTKRGTFVKSLKAFKCGSVWLPLLRVQDLCSKVQLKGLHGQQSKTKPSLLTIIERPCLLASIFKAYLQGKCMTKITRPPECHLQFQFRTKPFPYKPLNLVGLQRFGAMVKAFLGHGSLVCGFESRLVQVER